MQIVIADHRVAFFGERRERRVVGLKARADDDRRFLAHESGQRGLYFHVQIQRPIQQAGPAATAAVFPHGLCGGLLHLRVRDQVQIIVGPEHQHLARSHADFARCAPFAVTEYLEIHVEPGGLQIRGTGEIAALLENVVRTAAFLLAGEIASRYAHGPQFQS